MSTQTTFSRKRKEFTAIIAEPPPPLSHSDTSNPSSNSSSKASRTKKPRNRPDTQISNVSVLLWPSTEPHVPLTTEDGMMKVILRWGAKERGMLKDQPEFRFREIHKSCKHLGFRISQACSLRRHHMQQLNPYKSKEALKLGTTYDIRKSAELFEKAIANFLHRNKVPYYSEQQQKSHHRTNNPGIPQPGTPDFKLKQPLLLKVYSMNNSKNKHKSNNNNRTNNHKKRFHEQRQIHWIEAKMFYGASTIPADGKSAVGSILPKVTSYVEMYGPGAIVFSQGCGEKLANELNEIGVTALSCFSPDFDFQELFEYQRKWCGDAKGNILP